MHKLLVFKNDKLLRQALTHRSYVNEHAGAVDNERLEFLGDALLTFLSGEYLYRRFPNMGEDEMTRRRAALVDEKQLARFAKEIDLTHKMRLSRGVIQEGGYSNPNLLSSAFEAVVGAYYLDNDCQIDALRPIVQALFDGVPQDLVITRSTVDVKNRLQEWVQANVGPVLPRYVTEKVGGMDHAPEFVSTVLIEGQPKGKGRGRSKKEAEKLAAEETLNQLAQAGLL